MSLKKINISLEKELKYLDENKLSKRNERVILDVKLASGDLGPRYIVEGLEKPAIRLNSNSYLGLSLNQEMLKAEEETSKKFGLGPGAVRFISGTYQTHKDLEKRLAKFHKREKAMIFSSAYVTSMGVISPLVDKETSIISDELNHNCIINAMKISKPLNKKIYKHNDLNDLEEKIKENINLAKRILIVSDGIFSMRGDVAPLKEIVELANKYNDSFKEGIITIIDDSHGVGAIGETGRGSEEYCNTKVDILIGTLGKAFGVNGGYVVSNEKIISYLKEKAPMYIYSNPISTGEAAALIKALDILDSNKGINILKHLKKMTKKFEQGLINLGYETIKGEHPVVPLMIRDTKKTNKFVKYLFQNSILVTGLSYPVVPKGDEEIRFQISAEHTDKDIDIVLEIISKYKD